jgi:hypothetical protein
LIFFFNFEILWNFMKTEIFKIFTKFLNFQNFQKILNFHKTCSHHVHLCWSLLSQKNQTLSDDNARGSRITITIVCPISDVQLKISRKLFKLPVNSSAAVNSLENYGPVNGVGCLWRNNTVIWIGLGVGCLWSNITFIWIGLGVGCLW